MRIRIPSRRALTILARASVLGLALAAATPSVLAFCGFYVAKADGKLSNKTSQIIIARDGNRTNITMTSDFQGNFKDFAMVVPVPSVLQKDQIRVVDANTVSKLDAYSVPRLVEYFDEDPCVINRPGIIQQNSPVVESGAKVERDKALGVTVEAQYTVGEYDIVILSATQSDGLETWLRENNYKIPTGARAALEPYITGGMKFFVAKVNLENFSKTGFTLLRPLQMSFETPMFMLPLRLGMLNAVGDQDLVVYALTRKGRVETVNYPNVKIPTDTEVPLYVKNEFGKMYAAVFKRAYERENKKAAFLEYAWNTSNCDPCSSDPPTIAELERAGAGWVGQGSGVFLTRIHVRYNKKNFKEDLMFRETNSQENFQARYILRHPWKGEASCDEAKAYLAAKPKVLETQAQNLARLTGWKIEDIRRKAGIR
jgi:hypothetical protein